EIDAVMLHGDTGGGFAAMSAGGAAGPGALSRPRVSSVRRVNRGPSATLAASGPVALGTAVDFLFSNPRDRSRSVLASSFRYSFDFNNDGDFTDPGEVQNSAGSSARHTVTRRGWHIIHGRVRAADGRFTDLWLRVFVS
ncbi:MAG: hypothetical protein L0Y71_18285, partial [Gemmataceae bacterium]|nr:hypothetical protein [Gemmataceae bacterium]